ncbi:MAG: SurA N-terminal domain-containing protein [Pseudomonadota bacterium]
MLELLRASVGGIVAKIFIGLLVISFAVWGVADVFNPSLSDGVLSVGETKVSVQEYSRVYNRNVNQASRRFGRALTREQARLFGIENQVLAELVAGATLDENARIHNLGLSKESLAKLLAKEPAFQDGSGAFSRQRFQDAISASRTTEEEFIQSRKSVALRNQVWEAASAGELLPAVFFDAARQFRAEERKFEFITVTKDNLTAVPTPSDADLKTYFDANLKTYAAPEYRKVAVLKLEASDLADEKAVAEADVKADFERRIASYTTEEKRRVQQIVFKDKAEAEKFKKDLSEGAFFETLLTEIGKTSADIDLGLVFRTDIPDPKVAEAAFSQEMNKLSDVIDGQFGPILVRVTEIAPKTTKPLKEVEEDIRKALALQEAQDLLVRMQEEIEDQRAGGASLEEVAKKQNLKLRIIDAVSATGQAPDGNVISDIPESRQVLAEAFRTDVGNEANLINFGTTGYVWIDVLEITQARDRTQDEVAEKVKTDWIKAETDAAIDKLASELKERLEKGADIKTLATELKQEVKATDFLLRSSSHDDLNTSAITAGFSGTDKEVFIAPAKVDGDKLVMRATEIKSLEADAGMPEAEKRQLNEAAGNEFMQQFVGSLREEYGSQLNQANIETALSHY